jgi:hypothetical protein
VYIHACGTPEHQEAAGTLCKWPQGRVTYHEDLAFVGLTRDQVSACYDRAAQQWAAVCGLEFVRVASPAGANIVARNGAIDGPYGVLAQSQLPCGVSADSTMEQEYDNSEPWSQEGLDMLVACMCHEIGHAIGLNHLPGTGALMEPIIVAGRSRPQPADIAEAQARYGPPKPTAAPADGFQALGKSFAPYVVGPFCDGLVQAAKQLEQGSPWGEAMLMGESVANTWRDICFLRLIEGKLPEEPKARAAALRQIAAGLATNVGR